MLTPWMVAAELGPAVVTQTPRTVDRAYYSSPRSRGSKEIGRWSSD